ncbi:MAG: Anthranilate phosphoribosyltransferase, partial [Alphaproteobacteria bacterium MarineAlpha8_Bin1]
MISVKRIFKNLLEKKDLDYSEATKLVQLIFNNKLSEIEISSILTLLYIKEENFDEIYSFVEHLKKKCESIPIKGDLMDTCGTGGDNKNSFN